MNFMDYTLLRILYNIFYSEFFFLVELRVGNNFNKIQSNISIEIVTMMLKFLHSIKSEFILLRYQC